MTKKLTITLTSTYFSTNIVDSLAKNNFMNALSIGFPVKKIMIKAGAKHFSNLNGLNDYGAMIGCSIPFAKLFSFNLEGQKFVIGDYFLSNNFGSTTKVPWYFNCVLGMKF